jgi:hypothetical protein
MGFSQLATQQPAVQQFARLIKNGASDFGLPLLISSKKRL